MSKTKFTKGPWSVGECSDGVYSGRDCLIKSELGEMFGPRQLGYRQDTNVEANAQLCATAPDLYDALENLLEAIADTDTSAAPLNVRKDLGRAEALAEQVLKKARGEG